VAVFVAVRSLAALRARAALVSLGPNTGGGLWAVPQRRTRRRGTLGGVGADAASAGLSSVTPFRGGFGGGWVPFGTTEK
jgi:hypothetical protein